MIFFGHIGLSVGAIHAADRIFKTKTDLRKVAAVAIAADIIDKPAALVFPEYWGNHSRLFAHSLALSVVFLILLLLLRQSVRTAVALWFVYLGHLVLDTVWRRDLHALFWPFRQWPGALETHTIERWRVAMWQPQYIAGEVVGLSILLAMFWGYQLYKPGRLRAFLNTGML